MDNATLENQSLTARKIPEIFAQRRNIVDPAHAVTTDIGLGDQWKGQPGGTQRLPGPLEIGVKRASSRAARHRHGVCDPVPLAQRDIEQIVALRFAPDAALRVIRIRHRGQRQRPVPQREADPAHDQGDIEQAQRNALRPGPAREAARCRHAMPALSGRGGRLFAVRRRLLEAEDLPPHKADRHQNAKQERPRPQSGTIIECSAEENYDAEHERQVERGRDQSCHGEPRQRHARPAACHEGNEDDTRHDTAERNDSEQVALERVAEGADSIVDREAREPRQMSRPRADPVQSKVARDHAAIDAQHHEPDRHDVVHDDIGPEDDREVLVRERQEYERKELRQPRKVVLRKVHQS